MAQWPPRTLQQRLLLVEGEEEVRFWEALLAFRGIAGIQVLAAAGKNNLRNRLPALTKAHGWDTVRWLGVMQDADDNPEAAFDRICSALDLVSLPVPRQSWETVGAVPQVIAFVLPDGQTAGDLEELVWRALQEQPAVACIAAYLSCLASHGASPTPTTKARVHAYLASLTPPDRRLGDAAADGLLPLGSPIFDRLLDLVRPM